MKLVLHALVYADGRRLWSASLGMTRDGRMKDGRFPERATDAEEQSMVFERTAWKPAVLAAMHSHRA
ncbi:MULTISPECIES: hypothetical protein [unclassified Mesorhizobium]|uniref:hypothetical protein n=1 Tax=unclassified Mesorhizobium TaxID=325217 RepID=UPI001125D9CE|nr:MULTISPECIES: hypothetical protein [unclassified Mesorhizobium]TPJ55839.1 hypothetical protein FJ426_04150 [Mesorhizobium sp. B2-6-4]TPN02907.1 hypothetical protein FJ966_00480 [Mesorhizobium sp. B2-1-5]